jgi:uncharacterized membrane protein
LRAVLGLPVLLFFPGYALLAALFPKRSALGSIEWTAFSLGVSIAVVSLIGLILNYTPWGITLRSALMANAVFIIAASIAAWCQRYRMADAERVTFRFNFKLPFGKNRSITDNVISGVLTLAILGAIVTIIYAYAAPKEGETPNSISWGRAVKRPITPGKWWRDRRGVSSSVSSTGSGRWRVTA